MWACFIHAYTYMGQCTHARVPKTMKDKFFSISVRFGMNPTSFGSCSIPPFLNYKKTYMIPFRKTQKILRENTRFTRNSESKREFFTKHPQVNIFLIEAFFDLDL